MKAPFKTESEIVLKFNADLNPLYWIDLDTQSLFYRKICRRINDGCEVLHVSKCPKYIQKEYKKFLDLL